MSTRNDESIDPMNLSAQLGHTGTGNPPSALPDSAISNAFPGLEFDFRNIWRRLLVGVELHESDNYVVDTDPDFGHLKGRRLLAVGFEHASPDEYEKHAVVGKLVGPSRPGAAPGPLTSTINPDGVTMLEWSNSLAQVLAQHAGKDVLCLFTKDVADIPAGLPTQETDPRMQVVSLRVRQLFATNEAGERLAVIDETMVEPGDLTRGLCSPWQNDYRECACYYWAASRPDYVNVEENAQGTTTGNHWFAVHREPREYILDNRFDSRLVSYDDLFQDWQGKLRFVVAGDDYPENGTE
jgi:L-lysine epsilon oxidase C-terminal domain